MRHRQQTLVVAEHRAPEHDVDQRPRHGGRLETAQALRAVFGQRNGLGITPLSMSTPQRLLIAICTPVSMPAARKISAWRSIARKACG